MTALAPNSVVPLPLPPDELLHETVEAFRQGGDALVSDLVELGGLQAGSAVLEIGSGVGRTAHALWRHGHTGAYLGLDDEPAFVDWCEEVLTPATDGRLEFTDLEDGAFPVSATVIDVVLVPSMLAHALPHEAERCLAELGRVLKPGCRALAQLLVLDETWAEAVQAGHAGLSMGHKVADGVLCHDADEPRLAVGYSAAWLQRVALAAGLRLHGVRPGTWAGRQGVEAGPLDLLVLERA